MSETKVGQGYTPGPWKVVQDTLCETPWNMDICSESEECLVARVRLAPPVGDMEANARLIASAPDLAESNRVLLEALRELLFACKNQNQITAFGGLLERRMKEAEALIAAANGEKL